MTYQNQRNPIARNTEKVLKILNTLQPDSITEQLKIKILDREEVGAVKYGTTMDRKDYTRHDWLLHLLEELIDGAGYAMAAGENELCENLLSDARHLLKQIESLIK